MADRPDLFPDGNDTDGEAHLEVLGNELLDDAADEENEDAAGLIALDGFDGLFHRGSRPDHDDEAGNIAGDERHAQLAHFGVCEVAVVGGALIGRFAAGVLAGLDDLRGDRGGDAGGEDRGGAVLAGHQGADVGHRGLELAEVGHLLAQISIDAGKIICGRGHCHGGALAQLGNDGVQFLLGLGEHFVGAAEYTFK